MNQYDSFACLLSFCESSHTAYIFLRLNKDSITFLKLIQFEIDDC